MDAVAFVKDYIKTVKPNIPFQYSLLQEGRFITAVERLEKFLSTAQERNREEKETKQLIAALEKEKHDAYVEKKRCQQLMENAEELRYLKNYLATADAAKGRIAQLKMEDVEIDRRFEHAKEQAEEIRAEYRRIEQRQKLEDNEMRRGADELCKDLMAQIAEHDQKRKEESENNIKDGKDLKEFLKQWDEKQNRIDQAKAIAKTQLRKDTIENLRLRNELRKLEVPTKDDLIYYYKVEDERQALYQGLVDARLKRIKQREEIAAIIGKDILEKETAKRHAAENFIDYWVSWQKNEDNLLIEREQQKENETRQMLRQMMIFQAQPREANTLKKREDAKELARKRLSSSHEESEKSLMQKRMKRERWENEQFMKLIAAERQSKAEKQSKLKKAEIPESREEKYAKEIEDTRIKVLNEQPISLLRYLPSKLLRTDYLPEPLRGKVREEVLRDPIPMFNKKRHQPHLKRVRPQGGNLIKCCKDCPKRDPISNIF